jgi:GTPase SAR1 family protein
MKNNRNNDKIEFKIITIGDTIVGKTSIIRRYIENAFDEEIIQTVGIQKTKKK